MLFFTFFAKCHCAEDDVDIGFLLWSGHFADFLVLVLKELAINKFLDSKIGVAEKRYILL
jgi:hypothetical protein